MSDPYIGEIRMYAGNFAPVDWMFCWGQTVAIDDYETLFNLIGTTYGGDGQQTFALPDLRSRIPVGVGQLANGSGYTLGQSGGTDAVTVTPSNLPTHTHSVVGSSSAATSTSPQAGVPATWSDAQYSTAASPAVPLSTSAYDRAGGNESHSNMSPYLAVNFIISVQGIYPSPS